VDFNGDSKQLCNRRAGKAASGGLLQPAAGGRVLPQAPPNLTWRILAGAHINKILPREVVFVRCDGANEAAAKHQEGSETDPAARHDHLEAVAGPPCPQAFVGGVNYAGCAGGRSGVLERREER
jgi:hypothetical protein